MPNKGERRKAPDGTLIEWDGKGWKAASLGQATPPPVSGRGTQWTPTSVDTVLGTLPSVGGAVGGMLGAPSGPMGAIGGAALGGMAGEAARRNINMMRGAPVPTSGEVARSIIGEGAFQGGAQAAGAGLGYVATKAAPVLMQSALKPAVSLLNEYRTTAPDLAKVLLNEGINVTEGGIKKLGRLLTATNDEIKSLVASAQGTIPKKRVAAEAANVAQKVAKQTNPTKDLKAVGETVQEFLDHPVYKGDLTIPEAQAMKQGTYQQIGQKYGEISSAEVETQKALARGLKNEVAASVPEVSALNARDSQLMGAMDAVGHRVAIAGNRDPVGFAWAASQNPQAFLAALIDRSPAVKSMLARGLWSSASKATGVAPNVIRGAVESLAALEDEK